MEKIVSTRLRAITRWYSANNRWWLPLIAGGIYSLSHPPFNHETHWLLFPFPLLTFVSLTPFFAFVSIEPRARALWYAYLFGITASLTQFYWLANVMVEGVWVLIMLGLLLLTLFIALIYLFLGILYRVCVRTFGPAAAVFFPAIWIVIEWLRTLSEMSFPWEQAGYALTPVLPLAQSASLWGVYGLTFLAVCSNTLIWDYVRAVYTGGASRAALRNLVAFASFLLLLTAWGASRTSRYSALGKETSVALIQSNMDQAHWESGISLDTSMSITEKMVWEAAAHDPDMMIFPESGIFCYLDRNYLRRRQVMRWYDSTRVPLILGTLDFTRDTVTGSSRYFVYNAVFQLDRNPSGFKRYFKIKLVPFSEALPFEGIFPILSRVNLGESDFSRGREETILTVNDSVHYAPFVCYEIIYPDFVRRRIATGANLLVHITNDGWFGRSTAPYHHLAMARMRAIENGVSLARCANSGISALIDPTGRVRASAGLYTRRVVTGSVPLETIHTLYTRFGDWPVWLSLLGTCIGFVYIKLFSGKRSLS